jgi:hypothetical protein
LGGGQTQSCPTSTAHVAVEDVRGDVICDTGSLIEHLDPRGAVWRTGLDRCATTAVHEAVLDQGRDHLADGARVDGDELADLDCGYQLARRSVIRGAPLAQLLVDDRAN